MKPYYFFEKKYICTSIMFRLFNSNTPLVLILLPILLFTLWLPSFMSNELVHFENSSFLFNWLWIEHPLINKILAAIIIIFSGIQLNSIINSNEFFDKNTYIPAMVYVTMLSSIQSLHQLHPIVWSNLFWILGYRRIMNVFNQVQCKSEIFDASIFFGIATMIDFPNAGLMFFFPWVTLAIVRPFDLKEYLMPIFAMIILGVYLLFYFFFFDTFRFDLLHSAYFDYIIDHNWVVYVLYAIVGILLYAAGFKLIGKSNKSSIRFRKITSISLSFLTISMAIMLASKLFTNNDSFLLYASIPLTILYSFLFYYTEKKWFTYTLFYIGVTIMTINSYVN